MFLSLTHIINTLGSHASFFLFSLPARLSSEMMHEILAWRVKKENKTRVRRRPSVLLACSLPRNNFLARVRVRGDKWTRTTRQMSENWRWHRGKWHSRSPRGMPIDRRIAQSHPRPQHKNLWTWISQEEASGATRKKSWQMFKQTRKTRPSSVFSGHGHIHPADRSDKKYAHDISPYPTLTLSTSHSPIFQKTRRLLFVRNVLNFATTRIFFLPSKFFVEIDRQTLMKLMYAARREGRLLLVQGKVGGGEGCVAALTTSPPENM